MTFGTMLLTALVAAFAALPVISAQDTTSTSFSYETTERCTTEYGTASQTVVETFTAFTTTTSITQITLTTHSTITVTPPPATSTSTICTTTTTTTTTTSTPSPYRKHPPTKWLPLMAAGPTGIRAIKRYELNGRNDLMDLLKRQGPEANSTAGFTVNDDGTLSSFQNSFAQRVFCRDLVIVHETVTTTKTGPEETVALQQATETVSSTRACFTATNTVTAIAPQETIYEACQENNVVNHITNNYGQLLYFKTVKFPKKGLPANQQLVVDTVSASACCIACQNTPYCAGSFYAPTVHECHLLLTQAWRPSLSGNSTGNDAVSTPAAGAMQPYATGTQGNGTCSRGSFSLFDGYAKGKEGFSPDLALSFSNGPCGHWAVSLRGEDSQPGWKRALLGM